MNQHQLKQYLFNNAWFGENQRARFAEDDHPDALLTALLQPNYFRPWGLDGSHWDGILNLIRAKSLGMSFAFFKGMDGTIETRYFRENFTEAMRLNIPAAPYQWLYRNSNVSCVAQAQALDRLCQQFPPTLPAVIDFEATRYGGAPSNPDFTDLRKWAVEWLRLGNPKPLLYSGKYYMDGFGQMPADLKSMFAGLWLARYWNTNDPPMPPLPLGWVEGDLKYTQWTASGDQEFIAPSSVGKLELDLNYQMGATVPPPPGGNMTKYEVIGAQGLNLRTGPGTSFNVIRLIPTGSFVWGVLQSSGWIQGTKFQEPGGAELTQNFYCSGAATLVREVTAPPPAPDSITIDITAHDVKTPGDKYQATGITLQKVG